MRSYLQRANRKPLAPTGSIPAVSSRLRFLVCSRLRRSSGSPRSPTASGNSFEDRRSLGQFQEDCQARQVDSRDGQHRYSLRRIVPVTDSAARGSFASTAIVAALRAGSLSPFEWGIPSSATSATSDAPPHPILCQDRGGGGPALRGAGPLSGLWVLARPSPGRRRRRAARGWRCSAWT